MIKYGAVILAAGYSSRMGTLKPLLELGGVPVLRRVIDAFRGAGVDDICVVTGHERERLTPLLGGTTEVYNANYPDGMFSSVKAGIAACRGDYALITPADCVLLNPGIIGIVVLEAERGAKIVIPCDSSTEGHPVAISRELFPAILEYNGNNGLRGFLSNYESEIVRVNVRDEGAILDMDTPEDYVKMKNIVERQIYQ